MSAPSASDPFASDPAAGSAAVDIVATPAGFEVRRAGRAATRPEGRPLLLPTEPLARLVAAEWRALSGPPDWAGMLATRLALGASSAGPGAREAMIAGLARLAEHDLLCYRVEAPRELARRQAALWSPLVASVEARLGTRFDSGAGVTPLTQDRSTGEAVRAWAGRLNPFALVAVDGLARLYGSSILAIGVAEGLVGADDAFVAAILDETFQEEAWGEDAEAAGRREAMRAEAGKIGDFLAALREQ